MNKLVLAASLLTFGLAHAQSGKAEKPAAPQSGAAAAGAPPMMEMPKPPCTRGTPVFSSAASPIR